MMIEQMDKKSASSSRELVQRLYEKNIELENKRRKSAQARVPSDPNAWQQMRENYETIILEDHAFSEQHSIEYALWQLHYRRIEELRAHFSAALASAGSNTSQGVKGPARPDRISKIRLQFKTFLSEATGFYHELILKIRSKFGLPLGYFSEDSENPTILDKDGKKSAEIKKGLVSCHRCLIYLGDLARYKGQYGEGDSKTREYAAASSYYLQAASIWPSSGNPHHQLAILASYSGDELVAVYRYFRSLAVENPFSTARDNLIVAFEKNRQSYTQLIGDAKASVAKESNMRINGKGRGKAEMKIASKDTNMGSSPTKEKVSSVEEMCKAFCIRFVRLNGILFTRTSLETFADVLALVNSDLLELLSSGPEEELNFGTETADNAVLIVRLVCILIFTVHNLKRESEGQTYAEIVQRAVLLQNAFAAVFELMRQIIERCLQLQDISSSYLLPGILVFLEWLACCPDIASASSDVDEKQLAIRSNFWKQCILFLNKTLSVGSVCIDDHADETCFFNMSRYEEGETENRLALWEDFELRGFLPLLPAHTILDFSRKHSFRTDGDKEKKARLKRILAAGKALANIARVDQKTVCFDPKAKKFVIGVEPSDDVMFTSTSSPPRANGILQETSAEKIFNIGSGQPNSLLGMDGEEIIDDDEDDDDEVIVFKPVLTEKRTDVIGPNWTPYDMKADQSNSGGDVKFHGISALGSLDNLQQPRIIDSSPPLPVSVGNINPQHLQLTPSHAPNWSAEEANLVNGLRGLNLLESKNGTKPEMQEHIDISRLAAHTVAIPQSIGVNTFGTFYTQAKASEMVKPSRIDATAASGVSGDTLAPRSPSTLPVGSRKNPVSRPARHLGPPPGFSPVPPKPLSEPVSASDLENPLMDDYSWLDGYKLTSSVKGSALDGSVNYTSHANAQYVNDVSNGLSGMVSFPFPGKQVPTLQFQMEKQKAWQDSQALENLKYQHEQKLQQLMDGNQQFTSLPEQYQGQSVWTGRYFV
ncbi:hypothetical protein SLE2022_351750 [Rubroshorea leprosula]